MSLKILFFVTEDWFVCSHWLPLIESAKKANFEVVVVTQTKNHAAIIQKNGVRLIPFMMSRKGFNIFREFYTILRLIKIYNDEQPDIVHHVSMKPLLYGSFVAHFTRVPNIVNWIAGMGWLAISDTRTAKLLQYLVRKLLGILLLDTFVVVENIDDQEIISCIGIKEKQTHLIRGAGVDTLLYNVSPELGSVPLVILPARMLWDKGVGEFVDAARQLKYRGVKAEFVLVGGPDIENPTSISIQQLIIWQKEGVVEWWGRREDMPNVFAQSHIVCLPSYREGLPKALLEAAACGRPIVTTNVPGCREIVCDGDNGFLVEARNATALADALAILISDPALRLKMGRRGRDRVISEFSQEIIVSQVLSLYHELIS